MKGEEKIRVYQRESNEWINMEVIGQVKFVGKSFGVTSLTNEKIYNVVGIDGEDTDWPMIRVIDDSEEDYLYDVEKPGPFGSVNYDGKWELVMDVSGKLSKYFK